MAETPNKMWLLWLKFFKKGGRMVEIIIQWHKKVVAMAEIPREGGRYGIIPSNKLFKLIL